MITSNTDGISMEDFKCGREILMEIFGDIKNMKAFKPLAQIAMLQMSSF